MINKKWKKLQEGEKTSETMAVSAGRELQESDFHFLCWRGEMKYKKQAGGLKFEI